MERYIVLFEGNTKGKTTLQVNVVQAENKEHAAFNAALDVSSSLLIENASFSGVYTPEEIESCNSLELKLDITDSDKFVVIESTDHSKMTVEMLMKSGTLLDCVRWGLKLVNWDLKYEKNVSRIIIGEKLPSMTVNSSESLSLEMGKFAY
jgi:hypothetical protein